MSAECRSSVGRHVVLVNRPSVDSIGRYVGRHSADISANMLRSAVASVSVDCRWGIGRLLTVSLPTGDAKEESIAYARVLIEGGCSSNWRHFEYICNATSQQALSRNRRNSHEHIPECPIDGKKQSIDRYQSILIVSFNRWTIDNHRQAFNQEPALCVRMERGLMRVVSGASTQHRCPWPGLEHWSRVQ